MKIFKKVISLILALALCLSLAACGNNGSGNNDSIEEYLFEIPEEALAEYAVHGDFTTSHGPLVGNWEITFPLEQAD